MYYLKRLFWKVVNIPVRLNFIRRSLFAFPTWQQTENRIFTTRRVNTFIEDFDELDESKWKIWDGKSDWGTARSDNICSYNKENVFIKDGILNIRTIKEKCVGKDWNGKDIERNISSGSIQSVFTVPVKSGNLYRAKVRLGNEMGSWKAYWLFDFSGKGYSEIDGFEKFVNDDKNSNRWTFTIHFGKTTNKKTQFNTSVKKKINDWVIIDIITSKRLVKIKMNGVLCFISGWGIPKREMQVIFGDSASTHGNKLTEQQVFDNLPYLMEVDYFKIFKRITF